MYNTTKLYSNGLQDNLIDECLNHMEANGLRPLELIVDGEIHRYSADEKRHKKDEWYGAYQFTSNNNKPCLTVAYGSWSTDQKYTYNSWDQGNPLSPQEIHEINEKRKAHQIKIKQHESDRYKKAAADAKNIWAEAKENHITPQLEKYIKSKSITLSKSIRFGKYHGHDAILIPLYSSNRKIESLQYIFVDTADRAQKRFLKGGKKTGNFHVLPRKIADQYLKINDGNRIFVAEGYTTGRSIHIAVQRSCHVVVAFDAGNLPLVVENLRKIYPHSPIAIAGDADDPGYKYALKAARSSDCTVVFPQFPGNISLTNREGKQCTDFNDLLQLHGHQEVYNQIANTEKIIPRPMPPIMNNKTNHEAISYPSLFSTTQLPKVLRDHIDALSKTTQADSSMITASVLTTISAEVGTRMSVEYFGTLYPNLWFLIIAPSGSFKTTALNKGSKYALQKSKRIRIEVDQIKKELETTHDPHEKSMLIEQLKERSKEDILLPGKITTEGLIEHLAQGHHGAIYSSEFGAFLQNADKLHNTDLKATLTDFYDVPATYRYKTKTKGDHILQEPYISICGVSTIEWVKNNINQDDIQSGFLARFLLLSPNIPYQIPAAFPPSIQIDADAENAFNNIMNNLDSEYRYTISDQAKQLIDGIHQKLYKDIEQKPEKVRNTLTPYLKRWTPSLLKLAMIMQLFEDPDSTEITDTAVISAFSVLSPAVTSSISLFEGELGESSHQRKCTKLYAWISKRMAKTENPVRRQDILASKQLEGGPSEYDYILTSLIESGRIELSMQPKKNDWKYNPVEVVEEN